MAKINTARVIVGGLLAGVVGNACDIAWNLTVMKQDFAAMSQRFGLTPDQITSLSAPLPWILVDFILGFLLVWTYAAIRPRFGPGPKTALLAAVVPYVATTAVLYGFTEAMNMMPTATFVKGSLCAIVTTVLSSLAGCWLYREG